MDVDEKLHAFGRELSMAGELSYHSTSLDAVGRCSRIELQSVLFVVTMEGPACSHVSVSLQNLTGQLKLVY